MWLPNNPWMSWSEEWLRPVLVGPVSARDAEVSTRRGLSVSALTLWLSSATNSGLTWDHTALSVSAWSKRSKVLHRGEQGPLLVLSSLYVEETGEMWCCLVVHSLSGVIPPAWLCKLFFALHCGSNDSDKVFCSTEMCTIICMFSSCMYVYTHIWFLHTRISIWILHAIPQEIQEAPLSLPTPLQCGVCFIMSASVSFWGAAGFCAPLYFSAFSTLCEKTGLRPRLKNKTSTE